MKITFSDLREITSRLDRGDESFLCDYLNNFDGEDIYQKFRNVLKVWDLDVSPNLDLVLDGKNVKIGLSYILSDMPEELGSEITINDEDMTCVLDIPEEYTQSDDIVPIYDIIKYMKIMGTELDFQKVSHDERMKIIDNLPPRIYNQIVDNIVKKPKIVKFQNPVLKKIRLNFMTSDPYVFLRGLFTLYGNDYFRDVMFHLSKRIDGRILENSTIQDIEYYIERYNEEMKESQRNDAPTI